MSKLFDKQICRALAATQNRVTLFFVKIEVIVKKVFNVMKLEEGNVIECNLSTRNAKTFFQYFDDEKIRRTFRFDRAAIQLITELVAPHLPKRKTTAKRKISPLDQVLIALQFYATGTFQMVVGNVLKVSQGSNSEHES
ncbi:F14D2.9-like protein [Daphnia magna]|uniref:F14D2.9-like protein n=1 Tax=Daphnia magna TaxID=35525 RepID=A0A164LB96_9CRUS|nr:F14D2.9-like protein [Daphnia magna]